MSFYREYDRFISEIGNTLNDTQIAYLKNMLEEFVRVKSQNDDSNTIVDGLELQKEKLEKDIKELKQRKIELTAEIQLYIKTEKDLKSKNRILNRKKRGLQEEIAILESSLKGKAISKGIYEKRYRYAIELLWKIHEYAKDNGCESQKAFENMIKKKTSEAALKVCNTCGCYIKKCECNL